MKFKAIPLDPPGAVCALAVIQMRQSKSYMPRTVGGRWLNLWPGGWWQAEHANKVQVKMSRELPRWKMDSMLI